MFAWYLVRETLGGRRVRLESAGAGVLCFSTREEAQAHLEMLEQRAQHSLHVEIEADWRDPKERTKVIERMIAKPLGGV